MTDRPLDRGVSDMDAAWRAAHARSQELHTPMRRAGDRRVFAQRLDLAKTLHASDQPPHGDSWDETDGWERARYLALAATAQRWFDQLTTPTTTQ